MESTPISVVAAVIRRGDRYLVGCRPVAKRHGGLWEFPGGKINLGESLLEAARRELAEELSVSTNCIGRTLFSALDDDARFEIHFVEVEIEGDPIPHEHSEVGWFTLLELERLPLAPADGRFLGELRDRASPSPSPS